MSEARSLEAGLCAALRRQIPQLDGVSGLRRLSGGASQETWSFDARAAGETIPLVLRRKPPGQGSPTGLEVALSLEVEAQLIQRAGKAGVPVPDVRCVLEPGDGAGSGFVMERLEGETLGARIVRSERFARVRPRLARQCGEVLARLHSIPVTELPELPVNAAKGLLDQYRGIYEVFDHPRPVFELAIRWIEERLPETSELGFVHGDFRNGNLMIDEDGVRGVLDWELAHVGDPIEDLGWLCVNSWRFGAIDLPVGGFGRREDLIAGYEEAAGLVVDPERLRFWEVLGTLKWGVICAMQLHGFRHGNDRSVERAAIGRRASETEIDLLALIAP